MITPRLQQQPLLVNIFIRINPLEDKSKFRKKLLVEGVNFNKELSPGDCFSFTIIRKVSIDIYVIINVHDVRMS